MENPINNLTGMLGDRLHVGEPTRAGRLALYPVFHDWPSASYLLYVDAAAEELVEVTEVDEAGSVPHLKVANNGVAPVLFVEGEVLVGMKQTRTLNVTVLVAAKSETVIPVSCVEAGRWRRTTATAAKDDFHLAANIRAAKTVTVQHQVRRSGEFRSDQQKVWSDVDRTLAMADVDSPSASYADFTAQRRDRIDELAAGLEPDEAQTGVVAVIDGEIVAVDVFDSADTLTRLWRSLMGSYVAATYTEGDRTSEDVDVAGWLDDLAQGSATVHPGVGSGTVVELSGARTVGTALAVDDTVVHLAAFPGGDTTP
jgi:hypothetical protein